MTINIQDNQKSLRKGLNQAADIITSSMGPKGNTVIVSSNRFKNPLITKDGVSIARSIKLPDPIENIGAQLLISACNETVKQTGDSTTLTALLLQEMVNNTHTKDEYKKLEEETKQLKEYIKAQSKNIESTEEIYNIAKTSSNSDYIAELIKEVYDKTSLDVNIEIEITEEKNTTVTVENGYLFDSGFDYNWQVTNTFKQEIQYDDPTFYIQKQPLHTVTERLKNLLKAAIVSDQALVIVAEKFSREVISFIQRQVIHSKAKVITLKTPSWGEGQDHELENLQCYLSDSFTAKSIKCTPYYTIITNDDQPKLKGRLDQLKSLSENVEDPLEAQRFSKYYDRLSGNIATIWVGANTREEAKELYDRIEDAVGATRTAAKYGYVIGMGKCMYNFCIKPGAEVADYKDVWMSAYCKIANNAGVAPVYVKNQWNLGTDLSQQRTLVDLLKEGIIDPTNSIITAIDNALANTKLIINTKYILHNELQKPGI